MNLSIKNVPEDVVERLRERANQNHRSMQGEMLTILEDAVGPRKLSIEEVSQVVKRMGFKSESNSVDIVRKDRGPILAQRSESD